LPHSLLADWAERLGPADLVTELATLGDAVILDSRVLMASRAGSSQATAWPPSEERFASDFLDAAPVTTPWLAELTEAAGKLFGPLPAGWSCPRQRRPAHPRGRRLAGPVATLNDRLSGC